MNKKLLKETILETIFLLSDLNWQNFRRHLKPFKTHNPVNLESWISSYRDGNIAEEDMDRIIGMAITNLTGPKKEQDEIIGTIIKLNNLLDKDKMKPILSIAEEIEKVQSKEIITVKEFTQKYGYGVDWQKNRRGRKEDILPYNQTIQGGKITYNISEVDKWFKRNNISEKR